MFRFFSSKQITELESKLASLEAKVVVLEKRLAQLSVDSQPSEVRTSRGTGKKEKHILAIMEKTGWSREHTISQVEKAKARVGITYGDYDRHNFHTVAEESQQKEYQKIREKKGQKKQSDLAKKHEENISQVMANTGWDRAYAKKKMDRAKEVAGASYEQYVIFRFWELSEEEQKTYFTRRDSRILRAKYNTNPAILKILMNKDLCCKKLEAFLGRPWMSTEGMTYTEFCEKFGNESKIIYKPRAASGGHGIQLLEMLPGKMEEVYKEICALPAGIIEGYLVQHPQMKRLSTNSVNTIRVVTIKTDMDVPGLEKNKVNFLYAGVRMGQGDSFVDNLHSGGLMAVLDIETGVVATGGVDHTNTVYYKHPATGVDIVGFQIPYFAEIKQLIERASADLPGYFGWDVAITENGPVIVEVNTSPGADGLQTPYVPEKRGMRHVIEKYL